MILTWGHKFNGTLHMQTEAYYLWQFDGDKGGSCNYGPVKPFGGGGGCGPLIPGRSDAIAAVNYFEILLSPKSYISLRTDYLNDVQGQRTGYATPYGSFTAGWARWLWPLALLRVEARYDEAFSATPYDNGTAAPSRPRDRWTSSFVSDRASGRRLRRRHPRGTVMHVPRNVVRRRARAGRRLFRFREHARAVAALSRRRHRVQLSGGLDRHAAHNRRCRRDRSSSSPRAPRS